MSCAYGGVIGRTFIVLGIRNQLMMDDGVGIYLVEELADKNEDAQVHYLVGESDVDYCLEKFKGRIWSSLLMQSLIAKELVK